LESNHQHEAGGVNKERIDEFWRRRAVIQDPRLATSFRNDGRLSHDIEFVKRHLPENPRILDLGAGTCTLSLPLLETAREIVAVEKFPGFLDKAPDHPRLRKVCDDVVNFSTRERFDAILFFGVVNYLTVPEEADLYRRCAEMLTENGCYLVKNQCGVSKEVVVDSYSEELQTEYFARYPAVDEQRRLLAEHFHVRVVDVYPPELNRWKNTHFYGFACTKRAA
jgi:spermidine synthase